MKHAMTITPLIPITLLATALQAQPQRPAMTVDWSQVESRVAWFGTWDGAREAAEKTQRPILLVSAAPHCRLVPGLW